MDMATISWSTDAVEPAKRLEAWQSFLVDAFEECDMQYQKSDEFWASITSSKFGNLSIGKICGSERKGTRSPATAKLGTDGIVMSIACRGKYEFHQADRSHLLEPGEAYFFHNCLPGAFSASDSGDYWLISVPANAVAGTLGDTSSLIGCRIGHEKPELRLLTAYLQAIYQTPGLRDASTRDIIGKQVTDLVVATAGRVQEEAQIIGQRGMRAARYRLILEEIGRRYAEPMLNGERIAKALGVSERYVQQLFEENGVTVSAYIQDERLKAARRQLADHSQDHRTVTDIAYACGFSDASHFNRCFRKKFGETPTAIRQRQ